MIVLALIAGAGATEEPAESPPAGSPPVESAPQGIVEPLWSVREGAMQWIDPAIPAWPAEVDLDEIEGGVRCDALLAVDRETGEVPRVQLRGCPEPFEQVTRAALETWQAKVRDGAPSGHVGVRVGVVFVVDPAWLVPVGLAPIELWVQRQTQSSCLVELEVTPKGRATLVAATRPDCLELPVGNDWLGRFPTHGVCTVVPDDPVQVVSCDPEGLTKPTPGLLAERLQISDGWAGRQVLLRYGEPVRTVAARVELEPTIRTAPAWDESWIEDPPADRVDCTVELAISAEGTPVDVVVWSCEEPFASRVGEAVLQWRWEPPTLDGEPARVVSQARVGMQLTSTLPESVSTDRYLELQAQTGWLLDELDTEDCVVAMDVSAGGEASGMAANRVPDCLVAPAKVKLPGKWRKEASGPAECRFRVEARDGRASLLSVSECPDTLKSKVLEGGGLDDWRFNGGPGSQLYEVVWTVDPG